MCSPAGDFGTNVRSQGAILGHAGMLKSLYEAFARGDIPFILSVVAEDAEWEVWPDNYAQKAGVPWMQPRRGPGGAEEFFGVVAEMEFHRFEVKAILEGPGCAAGVVAIDLTYKPTGKRFADEEIHFWTFNGDGKIASFRHFADTSKHIEACIG